MDTSFTDRQVIFNFKTTLHFAALLFVFLISDGLFAQVQNLDAITLFDRTTVGGTASSAGSGGAYSSVGGDISSLSLNPAGLGLLKTSDISITPGLRIANDQSIYNGSSLNTSHSLLEFAQAGAVFTKDFHKKSDQGSSPFGLKSITFGINYQADNSFDRNQSFNYLNTSHSLIDNYVNYTNQGGQFPDAVLFNAANIMVMPAGSSQYYSNVKAPVQQKGTINTSGGIDNLGIGMGANLGDKLYFGFSLGIPIFNYSVNTQVLETNANANDTVTHFQGYQFNSNVRESGEGVTGKVGLIYKPASWVRVGVSYVLPTWYFLTEEYNSSLIYSFDTMSQGPVEYDGSADLVHYRIRTPMKGIVGASFYLNENSFISADYEFQNLGSTHYSFTDPGFSSVGALANSYLKTTYGYSHVLRTGIQGAIKKLRLRAGYSYTNSPFKSGQNYTTSQYNQAIQTATVGIGLRFKAFYIDMAYVFTYSKDGISPNYMVPLDQINSTYMTHSVLLTLGVKIPAKGGNGSSTQPKRRSGDQLPKNLDPDNKY